MEDIKNRIFNLLEKTVNILKKNDINCAISPNSKKPSRGAPCGVKTREPDRNSFLTYCAFLRFPVYKI